MPQDSFRSVVYRSFVTCDDPKGVVEYGTSKKSKTRNTKTEDKSQMAKTKETDSMEDINIDRRSSLQLLEVSREAQKLNKTIDSWSNNELSFDGHLAKSLLRGAIDLQESLVMLGKMQDASRYMSKLKKKSREKVDEARSESTNRTYSNRYGDEIHHKESQDLKRSGDGSSSDTINELRRVVRDSFTKQNLLPDSRNEEKVFYETRKLDSPCTSSSQSSEMYSKDKSKKGTVDDNGTDRMDSGRFDDQNCLSTRYKKPHFFANGSSNDSFEELTRAIRHGLAQQNLLPHPINERKSYHDHGRFDSCSEVASTSSSHLTSTASSSSSTALEKAKSPNLIAKLMGLDEFPSKQTQPTSLISNSRRPVSDFEMPKTRNRHFVAPKADPERRTLRDALEAMHFKGLLKSKPVNVHKKVIDDMPPIVIMKSSHFSSMGSEKVGFIDTHATSRVPRKLQVKEELPPTGTGRKKRHFNTKEKCINPASVQEKPGKQISQITKSAGSKVKSKALVPVTTRLQKDSVSDKKAQTVPKVTLIAKKELNAKSKTPLKSGNANVTLVKTSKHQTTNRTKQIKNPSSSNTKTKQTMKGHQNKEATASNFVAEYNDSKMNLACDVELIDSNIETTTLANQVHAEEEHEERFHDDESFLSEAATPTNHHDNMRTILKDMLFNSPSFITRANNLLGFFSMEDHPTTSQSSSVDIEEPHSRLFLDCANELLERRIHQVSQPQTWSLQRHLSLDQLANEVYDEVDILRRYANLGSENFHKEGVLSMLDHDLRCKESLSSVWEASGWKTGFSRIEVEEVGFDIEKIMLEGLIDEIFLNHVV